MIPNVVINNRKIGFGEPVYIIAEMSANHNQDFDQAVKPKRDVEVILADGTKIHRKVSECHFRLGDAEGHSPIILGEKGDDALLGVVTLENLGLVLDPFQRTLRNMQMRLS